MNFQRVLYYISSISRTKSRVKIIGLSWSMSLVRRFDITDTFTPKCSAMRSCVQPRKYFISISSKYGSSDILSSARSISATNFRTSSSSLRHNSGYSYNFFKAPEPALTEHTGLFQLRNNCPRRFINDLGHCHCLSPSCSMLATLAVHAPRHRSIRQPRSCRT